MPEFVGLVIVDVTAGGAGLLRLGCGRGTCMKMQGKYFNQLRTYTLIVSVHPYCAHKFTCHVMHERALSHKINE